MRKPPARPKRAKARKAQQKPSYRDLKDYFARAGVTQEKLAGRVGISQAHMSRLADGLSIPRGRLAVSICEQTGVPLDSFTKNYVAKRTQRIA